MKTILTVIIGAFIATVLAWVGLVLLRPKASPDQGVAVAVAAFMFGGAGGFLWRPGDRRRGPSKL